MYRGMKIVFITVLLFSVACSGDSPTSPSPQPVPLPAPATTRVSLTGVVTVTGTAIKLDGVTVTILDGANAGKVTRTDGTGSYRFDDLVPGPANLSITAPGWEEVRWGVTIDGTATLNFSTRTIAPWTRAGTGNTVFDMPVYISRVRITGRWNGNGTSNFIVYVGGRLVVNEVLRTGSYDGIHTTTGGTTETVSSNNITWTFTEVR